MDQVLLGMSSDRLSTLPSLNEQAFVNLIKLREAKSLQIRMVFFTFNGWGGGSFSIKKFTRSVFLGGEMPNNFQNKVWARGQPSLEKVKIFIRICGT